MRDQRRVEYEKLKIRRKLNKRLYEDALRGIKRLDISKEFKMSPMSVLVRIRELDPDFKFKRGRRKDYKGYKMISEEVEKQKRLKKEALITRQEILEKYYYAFFPFEVSERVKGLRKQASDISSEMWKIRDLRVEDEKTSKETLLVLNDLHEERIRLNKIVEKFERQYITKEDYARFQSRIEETRK